MRILFLTDNFPPEYNAPATRTYEHCKEWVKQGANVTVITGFPNFPAGKVYEGYRNSWKKTEYIDGIKVIRVWTFISANSGTFKRVLDFVSFAIASFLCGLTIKCDIIIATSPQFFTAISGWALGVFKRKRWVMEVRDIWPESIKAVEAVNSKLLISVLEKIELFLYKTAFKIIVVTDSFKVNLTSRGVPAAKIHVIKNGVDLSKYSARPKSERLLNALKLKNKFVVGYIGTHGLAHSLDFILKNLSNINDTSFHFLFIGDGAEKKNLIQLSETLQLGNVTFIDPVQKTVIPEYLSLLDVALVPLKKSTTFESVIPSKIFESVAMSIPILLGVDGESREIIQSYKSGFYFEPENSVQFMEKLLLIRSKLDVDRSFFVEGCKKMANDFDRRNLAKEMLQCLTEN